MWKVLRKAKPAGWVILGAATAYGILLLAGIYFEVKSLSSPKNGAPTPDTLGAPFERIVFPSHGRRLLGYVVDAGKDRKSETAVLIFHGAGENIGGANSRFFGVALYLELGAAAARIWDVAGQMANFLQAVRNSRRQDLTADVEVGVTSAALCHLANISYRLRRMLAFDAGRWEFPGDSEANRLLTRDYRAPFAVPEKV